MLSDPLAKGKNKDFLATVPYDRGFHFFTAPGKYTGETATSLISFREKLKVIETESVKFHVERHDFQHWIKGTLGDSELAEKISKINLNLSAEEIRKQLVEVLDERINELKEAL